MSKRNIDTPTLAEGPVPIRRTSLSVQVAAGLAIALVIAIGVAGLLLRNSNQSSQAITNAASTGPIPLASVDAPQAGSAECAKLLTDLPTKLTNAGALFTRRTLAAPAPPATAAWSNGTSDPVVLRCGVERPSELTPTSELLDVSGVEWLQVNEDSSTTWYAVDRSVTVALTLPSQISTGPIQDISEAINAALPATPVQADGS